MDMRDHDSFFIDGDWQTAQGTDVLDVISPRSEERIATRAAKWDEDYRAGPRRSSRGHRCRRRRRAEGLRLRALAAHVDG